MIGGEHFFTPPGPVEHSLGELLNEKIGEISFFSTGRDALFSLLTDLPQKSIYLPDLICASVHQACLAAGKAIITYTLGENLLDFRDMAIPTDEPVCLLVMHYFGVTNSSLLSRARQAGLVVISDVTHMLFNAGQLEQIARKSDYLIASLRKSGALPDGGFVSSRTEPLIQATQPIREKFFSLRAAGLLSRGFSAGESFCDDENFNLLKKAEDVIERSSLGPYACSYLSGRLIFTVNVSASALIINGNMQTLFAELEGICTSPCQLGFASPYFCCVFRNRGERDFVRARLAAHQYYCPVHWDTARLPIPSPLSELCLSIPCDARYSEHAMKAITGVIKSCLGK